MSNKTSNTSKEPRINIAFYDDHLEFCRAMALKSHQSVTRYVNCLIAQEKAKHNKSEWEGSADTKKE